MDAIWRDDAKELRSLVLKHPYLLHEMARGTEHCNWGPPMSYAANLGRDRIIQMLGELGAEDIVHAMGRALLQGQIETARRLYAMGARPPSEAVMGPAEPKRSRSWKSPEMSGLKLPAPKAGQFPNHTTIHGCPCEGVDIHASGIKGMVTSGG